MYPFRQEQSLFSSVLSLIDKKDQFNRHSLDIDLAKWQDCARNKNSSMGPNISDVTLNVKGQSFPIIGTNNYRDPTFDLPIERFKVTVGNEKSSSTLKRITLKNYLKNIDSYIDCSCNTLFSERDEVILTSAQTCILPLENGKVEFNVEIKNYQYDTEDPAVLCLVVSPHGTSAQLLTKYNQKIYFNNQGSTANYMAERLKDVRRREGRPLDGPMNQKEKEENALFIFQIPLRQRKQRFTRSIYNNYDEFNNSDGYLENEINKSSSNFSNEESVNWSAYAPSKNSFDVNNTYGLNCAMTTTLTSKTMQLGPTNNYCFSDTSVKKQTLGFDNAQLSVGSNKGI